MQFLPVVAGPLRDEAGVCRIRERAARLLRRSDVLGGASSTGNIRSSRVGLRLPALVRCLGVRRSSETHAAVQAAYDISGRVSRCSDNEP